MISPYVSLPVNTGGNQFIIRIISGANLLLACKDFGNHAIIHHKQIRKQAIRLAFRVTGTHVLLMPHDVFPKHGRGHHIACRVVVHQRHAFKRCYCVRVK
jgi:hypothetical protein